MKRVALLILLCAGAAHAQSYTTLFPATENPISESGNWVGGQTAGGNIWGNVQTGHGSDGIQEAFGVSLPTSFGDPTALITGPGPWGANQTVTGTVHVITTPTGACCHEIELRLRMTITASNISGYEAYCSIHSNNQYCHIARWNGPNGSYCNIETTTPTTFAQNGDALMATVTGSNPTTVNLYKNGTLVAQAIDTGQGGPVGQCPGGAHAPLTSGSPGIGFFDDQDSNWNNFGFTQFAASTQATNYCNNQIYQTFEGGATGALPGATDLQSTSHGGSAVTWGGDTSGTLTYSSPTNDMPALVAPGRLCGDLTTYTNAAGSHSLQMQFDGGADFFHVTAAYAPASDVIVSFEYNEDFAQTDGSKIDTVGIVNNLYGTIAFNAYGIPGSTRYYSLEVTGQAAPNINWTPSTQCPCKITMHFRTGTASTGGNITLNVQDKNGVQLTPISVTSNVGVNTSSSVRLGDQCNCAPPTAGKHVWYDNVQISFDGSIPGQFCAGSSPTWTSSPDSATLQGCLTGAVAGDTVNVLSGTTTWNGGSAVINSHGVSMAGATTCSNTGTASASCVDNDLINWTNSTGNGFFANTCPASGVMTISGLTFNWIGGTVANSNTAFSLNGNVAWPVPAGPAVCFRMTNFHVIANDASSVNGAIFGQITAAYGVLDHFLYDRLGGHTGMFQTYGDSANSPFGNSAWQTLVGPGSQQVVDMETYTINDNVGSNTEGPNDGDAGCRTLIRFGTILNTHDGGNHGTDSGNVRGCMLQESYGNNQISNINGNVVGTHTTLRSGTMMNWGNTDTSTGGGGAYAAMNIQCLRCDPNTQSGNDWGNWNGFANGTKWTLNSANTGNIGATQLARNFPDFIASHTYNAYDSVVPLSGNSGGFVYTTYSGCAAGAAPGTWNQGVGQIQITGACSFVMSDGVAASGGPYGVYCGDALVAVGSSCATGLKFFDSGAGINSHGYPERDQIGRAHATSAGQDLVPVYAWNNLSNGVQVGLSIDQGPFTDVIVQNRDYYSFPSGVSVGTLAAMPGSCTPGTGYFATNEGNWNTSGNGFGSGTLHICGAGGTFPATCPATVLNSCYVPLTYPHPLVGGTVSVSPSNMNFGSVVVGGNSSAQTAVLTNGTTSSITLSPVTITGANPSDFSIGANNCSSGSVAANGGTCSVPMQFFPTSTGARSATLTIVTSVGNFPVFMSGTGTSAVNPGVSINPASIAFGNMSVGSSTPATTVTITSTTSANLVMGTPPATITGTNAGDFSLQAVGGQCTAGQSIPQSSTCLENVVFAPTVAGARSAQLNIFNNVTGSPQMVPLSGTGVGTIALNPASINFGLLAQGQTSAGVPMTLINNTGVTITLTSVTYTNLDFAFTVNNCTGTLANGAQCSVTTTFRPSATTGTNETGFLQISYTGVGGSPASVSLAGTVLPPIGTPATNIFAKNLAGCGGPPKIATWCFTADRHIYISSCSGAPLVCGPYTPFTLMAQ